ncbi:MAG: hypothetical protein I8H87_11680 [Comamonadaceae bacterium]|nr:hypothetical protein [Comamonadaceae bacterium]
MRISINTRHHMLPLGWLPLTEAARRDGFLPVYRRLAHDGHEIIDKWGYLIPDLHWRHGRGKGNPTLEGAYALELLKAAAVAASWADHATHPHKWPYPCEWSPEYLVKQIPDVGQVLRNSVALDPSGIALSSPNLPRGGTRSEWLAALPQLLPLPKRARLGVLARDPARLVRLGYQLLCHEWSAHGQNRRQTGEALAIIGLGALGLFPRVRCTVCFRMSMPATSRCATHSQTQGIRVHDDGPSMHAQISSEARLAKRVMTKLSWAQTDFVTAFGIDSYVEEKTIGGILWGLHVGESGYTLQDLREGLSAGRFPRVRALLPNNFSELNDARACACLRRHIDPGEWVVSYWYTRVGAAEAWLEVAESLSPGRTQMKVTDQNRERVANARSLLQQGFSKKDVAEKLGISQSHLSHLFRRLN